MALQLATAAIDTPRAAHFVRANDAQLYETLLLEGGGANAFTYSEQLDNAAWVKTRSTVTPNATTAPNGTATADKLVEDTTVGNSHYFSRASRAFTANVKQTASVFLKAAERTKGRFYLTNVDLFGVDFDLTAGTVTPLTSGVGSLTLSRITALANGWYRISITGIINTTATGATAALQIKDSAGNLTYTGDGVSGLFVWRLQFEADAPFASSSMKTEAATFARGVDSFHFPLAADDVPQEQTWLIEFVDLGSYATICRVAQISNAAGDGPRALIYKSGATTGYRLYHQNANGGAAVESGPMAMTAYGDHVRLRAVFYADGSVLLFQSINGAAETAGVRSAAHAFAPAWSGQRFYLTSIGGPVVGYDAVISAKRLLGVRTLPEMLAA